MSIKGQLITIIIFSFVFAVVFLPAIESVTNYFDGSGYQKKSGYQKSGVSNRQIAALMLAVYGELFQEHRRMMSEIVKIKEDSNAGWSSRNKSR